MTRELEASLWAHIASGNMPRTWVRLALDDGRIASPKQAWATLEKWADKRLYDYGVALDLGWLTEGATMPDRRAA